MRQEQRAVRFTSACRLLPCNIAVCMRFSRMLRDSGGIMLLKLLWRISTMRSRTYANATRKRVGQAVMQYDMIGEVVSTGGECVRVVYTVARALWTELSQTLTMLLIVNLTSPWRSVADVVFAQFWFLCPPCINKTVTFKYSSGLDMFSMRLTRHDAILDKNLAVLAVMIQMSRNWKFCWKDWRLRGKVHDKNMVIQTTTILTPEASVPFSSDGFGFSQFAIKYWGSENRDLDITDNFLLWKVDECVVSQFVMMFWWSRHRRFWS